MQSGKAESRLSCAGIDTFVDLTRGEDSLASYKEEMLALGESRGVAIQHLQRPIVDMSICDVTAMSALLDDIGAALDAGRTVYVHCWGGVGRTGTVIGCWLVRHGRSGDEALAEVAKLFATMSPTKLARHRGSPQTREQREMVRRWETTNRSHT